jgi:hypothetical protein
LVYPVDGGMEDWIYAAGWDQAMIRACNGLKDKIAVNNRAIVYLVETSDMKRPNKISLGKTKEVCNAYDISYPIKHFI